MDSELGGLVDRELGGLEVGGMEALEDARWRRSRMEGYMLCPTRLQGLADMYFNHKFKHACKSNAKASLLKACQEPHPIQPGCRPPSLLFSIGCCS